MNNFDLKNYLAENALVKETPTHPIKEMDDDRFWEFNDSEEAELLNSIVEKWGRGIVMQWLEGDE